MYLDKAAIAKLRQMLDTGAAAMRTTPVHD